MKQHKIKRKGKKFYPMYRGWSTMWCWGKYNRMDTWIPESQAGLSDDYWYLYFHSLEDAMKFVDQYKIIRSKDDYKL